jgi:uncharacterized membrane protein
VLETQLGLTIVNRIGVVTLILGVGFFFKWAVDNQWIGPAGRVELGILAGFIALGIADRLWHRGQTTFAQGITATGVAILYLAIYAAFGFYQLIPQPLAFVFMVTTTALSAALALRYEAVAIAALALVGGFLTPVLLSTGEARPWFLFSYVAVLDIGALYLGKRKQWRILDIISFVATTLIYLGWLTRDRSEDRPVETVYALVFYALYAAGAFQPILFTAQFVAAGSVAYVWGKDPAQYLFLSLVLAAAGLAVSHLRRWRYIQGAAFTAFWLFTGLWISSLSEPRPLGQLFFGLTAGFALFYGWVAWRLLTGAGAAFSQELVILALNGAAYFGVSYALLNPDYHAWMGLFAVALAGLHVGLGYRIWNVLPAEQRELPAVLLSLGVALTFLTLAVPIQLTAYRITMAWSLEAAALSWIGIRIQRERLQYVGALIFVLVWWRLLVIDSTIYATPDHAGLMNARFATFAITTACLWLTANWFRTGTLALVYYVAGHLVLLATLTQEIIDWAARNATPANQVSVETLSISLLYAVYAVVFVSLGVGLRTVAHRIAGLVLIGIVILKLYLFDIWQLGRLYRTLAFVALGLLLLSTSFLYSRFRTWIDSWWRDEAHS